MYQGDRPGLTDKMNLIAQRQRGAQGQLATDVVARSSYPAVGDLVTGYAPNQPDRLPVGDEGSILIADPTAPGGMRWGASPKVTANAKPYATVVVAASDSRAVDAADADFVCTGTGDNFVMQAAINYVLGSTSLTQSGRVVLLDGTYHGTIGGGGPISLSASGLDIMGMGGSGTNATLLYNIPVVIGGGRVHDMGFAVDVATAWAVSGGVCWIDNCLFTVFGGGSYTDSVVRPTAGAVTNCWLNDCVTPVGIKTTGIFVGNILGACIHGNIIYGSGPSVPTTGIVVNGDGHSIIGNSIVEGHGYAVGNHAVILTGPPGGSNGCTVVGNVCGQGNASILDLGGGVLANVVGLNS